MSDTGAITDAAMRAPRMLTATKSGRRSFTTTKLLFPPETPITSEGRHEL